MVKNLILLIIYDDELQALTICTILSALITELLQDSGDFRCSRHVSSTMILRVCAPQYYVMKITTLAQRLETYVMQNGVESAYQYSVQSPPHISTPPNYIPFHVIVITYKRLVPSFSMYRHKLCNKQSILYGGAQVFELYHLVIKSTSHRTAIFRSIIHSLQSLGGDCVFLYGFSCSDLISLAHS